MHMQLIGRVHTSVSSFQVARSLGEKARTGRQEAWCCSAQLITLLDEVCLEEAYHLATPQQKVFTIESNSEIAGKNRTEYVWLRNPSLYARLVNYCFP